MIDLCLIHLCFAKILQRTEEYYGGLNATPGPDQEIVFEADTITLDIPERDGVTRNSWKIVPLMKPQVLLPLFYPYDVCSKF